MKFSTKAIHVGQAADKSTGSTIVPIYQTSTFSLDEVGKDKGFLYSRMQNPTRAALEQCLAALESAHYALSFSSGMAAINAALSILRPGDHVVAMDDLYGGTYRLLEQVYKNYNITCSYVDGTVISSIEQAITKNTKIIWLETPSNPLLRIVDLIQVVQLAKAYNILVITDNTFATPYFQQPLSLGVDVVVHSTTKYIGGHSDVLGGAVITNNQELHEKYKFYQTTAGAVPGPFDMWLTLRGIKTLAVRMKQHEQNAFVLARALRGHAQIHEIHYPGLESHDGHAIAQQQMSGFGGVVSLHVKGGRQAAYTFLNNLKLFSIAISLGGVESLACHPASMTHNAIPVEFLDRKGITDNLVRLSVGIEDSQDLLDDVMQAFDKDSLISGIFVPGCTTVDQGL